MRQAASTAAGVAPGQFDGTDRRPSVLACPMPPDTGVPVITAFLVDTLACPNWTETLALILTNPGIIKVTHNGKFDLKFLMAAGVRVTNVFDTMLATQILDSGQHLGEKGYFTLAAVAGRYLGEGLDKSQQTAD